MKKLLFLIGILSFLVFNSFDRIETNALSTSISSSNCKIGQCKATAKSTGNRCKHCVSESGDLYCWQHKKN